MMSCRIAIVASIVVRYDAISTAVRNTYFALKTHGFEDITVYSSRCEYDDMRVTVVDDAGQLLMDRDFRESDLILYHFGIYHPLFDVAPVAPSRARQAVFFHNVTPAHLVPASRRPLIERSFRQVANFRNVDRFWCISPFNAECLRGLGLNPQKMEVLPLVVERPALVSAQDKPRDALNILYVGRAVPPKGLHDAISTFAAVHGRFPRARMEVAFNANQSDQVYLKKCNDIVRKSGIEDAVTFHETPDDDTLDELFRSCHILLLPTRHEGFCVPVIEALRAGTITVGYDAGNMRNVCEGLGKLVTDGDVASLTDALGSVVLDLWQAQQSPEGSRIRLDRGDLTISEFAAAAHEAVQKYRFERISRMIANRVAQLLGTHRSGGEPVRREILVLPDDEMRERERTSLNRLPDLSDWEAGGQLSNVMKDLCQPVCIHRKSWEYAICIDGLHKLGRVNADSVGLSVGAGSEPPLYYFANKIHRMVATDLYNNPTHEGKPAMLENPQAFAPFPYREDHLEVYRMPGDNLQFPDKTFDFTFSLSSIEHFGTRETQRHALDEIARTLKIDGVACLITELILTKGTDNEYFNIDEIRDIFLNHPLMKLVGGDLDLSISESLVNYPVNLENSKNINRSPHIVLRRSTMKWTSVSLFLQRIK